MREQTKEKNLIEYNIHFECVALGFRNFEINQ